MRHPGVGCRGWLGSAGFGCRGRLGLAGVDCRGRLGSAGSTVVRGGLLAVRLIVWILLHVLVPPLRGPEPAVKWVSYIDAVVGGDMDLHSIHGDVGLHADNA